MTTNPLDTTPDDDDDDYEDDDLAPPGETAAEAKTRAYRELREALMAKAAKAIEGEKQRETDDKKARIPEAASLYHPGTMTERSELLIGLLTNAAIESMILADGACPELTEQGYAERKDYVSSFRNNAPPPPVFKGSVTPYLAARSANLRDAVRASEAVARLINIHTLTRKACAGETVATVDEWQDGDKHRRRLRTVKRFGIAMDDVIVAPVAPEPPRGNDSASA